MSEQDKYRDQSEPRFSDLLSTTTVYIGIAAVVAVLAASAVIA